MSGKGVTSLLATTYCS